VLEGALGVWDLTGFPQGLMGAQTLASAHALHLPTNSISSRAKLQTFGIKPKASLCREECRVVVKLEVWPSGVRIRV